jgi:hypothetical protein
MEQLLIFLTVQRVSRRASYEQESHRQTRDGDIHLPAVMYNVVRGGSRILSGSPSILVSYYVASESHR